jgi:hypothetical protein
LVDLDGDGHEDVLSGSWPGELFFFRNDGKGGYEKPVKLKDKNGKTINIGGGVKRDADGSLLITGDGKFEQKDGKQYVVYEGQWIECKPEDSVGVTGTASAVFAHDWDGDGDFDLVVGDIRGNVYLIPNEGTKEKWNFGNHREVLADGKPLRATGGDAGPCVADWDGDGKPDLLVGSGDGSVWLYTNGAKTKGMELSAGQQLVPPVGDLYQNTPAEPTRGMRSKVCAADWNGDGRVDLLVGDFAYLKPRPVELTAEQKAEQDKARAEMEPLERRYREIVSAYFDAQKRKKMTAEERDKQQKELQDINKRMAELRPKIPQEQENHGWVWLFLRKPADQARAGDGTR